MEWAEKRNVRLEYIQSRKPQGGHQEHVTRVQLRRRNAQARLECVWLRVLRWARRLFDFARL